MPKLTTQPPSYRRHKRSGQAVVTLNGQDHYLGPHGTKASKREYDRLIQLWLANGRIIPRSDGAAGITITELLARYWRFVTGYYVKDDQPTNEQRSIKSALRYLKALYGRELVAEFGPMKLKAVRESMVQAGHCRGVVNQNVGRIKRAFKWGVENEIVQPNILHGLQAIASLRRGRTQAKESKPVKPVPDAHVDAVRPYVSRQVWAIIELQRLTGMRSGEVVIMRGGDLDMTGTLWTYTPSTHKTAHHGHEKIVYLGPKAQNVIKPFLSADLSRFLFSPADARNERYATMRATRKSKVQPSQRNRRKKAPKWQPAERYTPRTYGDAIARACKLHDILHWHPHQLRHNAATQLRKEFGLEIARCVLGQKSMAVAEIYAELDRTKAADAMAKIG
jgi:integrase